MPGGDVTIKITFTDTPNPTNAFLQDLSSPAGLISPSFARTTLAYTINVPFNTKEFSIDAQAENPYLRPVLKRKDIALPENLSDGLLGENLIAPDDGTPPAYCLDGASAEYEITVTPEEGDPLKYTVTVNLLPDLSLAELKVTYNDSSGKVVRKLAPWMEEQTVYIPATTAVLEASPSSPDAAIDKPTQNVTGINADGKSATVTVSNQNLGKSSSYTVKLIYDGNLKPMASGGFINFIRDGVDYYETHTFTEAGTLSFNNGSTTSINADILLVGGGGGAGGGADRGGKPRAKNTDFPGGGGAGALLYKTGYTLALTSGSVQVSAGGGGAGGNTNKPGDNGQDSWIGVDSSSKTLVAPGGGGGGGSGMSGNGGGISGDAGTIMPGRDGGSGGGGGNGVGNDWGPGGQSTPTERDFLGNSGGNGQSDKGGGGGGAKGAGVNGGAGGAAWKAADESAAWIQGLTGTNEFSRGGQGGLGHLTPADGANFGDGGCAGKSETIGGSGHGGIVVIRFKYTAPTQ